MQLGSDREGGTGEWPPAWADVVRSGAVTIIQLESNLMAVATARELAKCPNISQATAALPAFRARSARPDEYRGRPTKQELAPDTYRPDDWHLFADLLRGRLRQDRPWRS